MVLVDVEINGKKFKIHEWLKRKLDNVKKIMKKEWDCVFLIDGIEGSGKSTLSFACGWYISDGKMAMKNICEGTEDAIKKLQSLPDGSLLIIDEGSLSFSSTEVMRREQRQLVKILNVIRQRCMCLIIVAPSFFNLNKYISVERSRFLLHVYTDKNLGRGRFCYFGQNKKKKLYTVGKKHFNSYSKPKSDFTGSFTKFQLPFASEYLKHKDSIIQEQFVEQKPQRIIEAEIRAPIVRKIVSNLPIKTRTELANALNINRRTVYAYENPGF
jgi:DNA-binding CsgD family transcriptional regulator